jgi:hypothetical protein
VQTPVLSEVCARTLKILHFQADLPVLDLTSRKRASPQVVKKECGVEWKVGVDCFAWLGLCCGAMAPTKGLPLHFDVSSRCLSVV